MVLEPRQETQKRPPGRANASRRNISLAANPFASAAPLHLRAARVGAGGSASMNVDRNSIFAKNLPLWERLLRLLAGVGAIGYGGFAAPSVIVMAIAIAAGATLIVTSLIGFC